MLQQEMMSRRFIGVLLVLVLQQIMTADPAMHIAHQQRGVSVTGAIGNHVPAEPERHDP